MKNLDFHLNDKINFEFYKSNGIMNYGKTLCAEANVGEYSIAVLNLYDLDNKYLIESKLNGRIIEIYDAKKMFELIRDVNRSIPIMYKEKDKSLKQYTFDRFINLELNKKTYDEEVLKTMLVVMLVGEIDAFDVDFFNEELKSFCLYLIQCLDEKDINLISKKIKDTKVAIPFGA